MSRLLKLLFAPGLIARTGLLACVVLACATTAQTPGKSNSGPAMQPGGVLRIDAQGRPIQCASDFFLCGPFPGGDNLTTCCLRGTRCSSVANTPACEPLEPGEQP